MLKRDLEIELVNKAAEITLLEKELAEKNKEIKFNDKLINAKTELIKSMQGEYNALEIGYNTANCFNETLEKTIVNFTVQKYK